MEISREDFERLVRSDESGRIFASVVLAAADEHYVDASIVRAAFKAIYPEAWSAEMQRRCNVKEPLYEIKTEGADGNN